MKFVEVYTTNNREAHITITNQKSYIKEVPKWFNSEFKIVNIFINVQRKMNGVTYKTGVGSLMYGGHKGQYCICGKYGEPIDVEGQSTALDGREAHHEVFERHFGHQIMPQRQIYYVKRFF